MEIKVLNAYKNKKKSITASSAQEAYKMIELTLSKQPSVNIKLQFNKKRDYGNIGNHPVHLPAARGYMLKVQAFFSNDSSSSKKFRLKKLLSTGKTTGNASLLLDTQIVDTDSRMEPN
ncbi:unnamed protein product [Ceratitis capitata]|uniref:(Mediterranean fruit fly) hypothetical protein n=1 Tax=Ceratitis capitata TaxID=7213 RepID=A0A811VI21_CERCA|nr:unnamed protein product [Ceratitis capitata]